MSGGLAVLSYVAVFAAGFGLGVYWLERKLERELKGLIGGQSGFQDLFSEEAGFDE